jgi:hypothetical protein
MKMHVLQIKSLLKNISISCQGSRNTSQIASTGKITTKMVKRWNLLGYTLSAVVLNYLKMTKNNVKLKIVTNVSQLFLTSIPFWRANWKSTCPAFTGAFPCAFRTWYFRASSVQLTGVPLGIDYMSCKNLVLSN